MSSERRDFDKEAALWDENPVRIKLAQDVARAISGQIVLTPGMNIMDFGCGTGLLALQLQPFVGSVTAVDSSRGMLDILDLKIARLKLTNVTSALIDPDESNPLRGVFDVVVSNMTLHHVKEIKPLLDQFYHIISPGGYLCIADLDLDGGQFHEDRTGVFHFGFDRLALRNAFMEAGFDNVRDINAAEVTKPTREKPFSIFLITGRKRSGDRPK